MAKVLLQSVKDPSRTRLFTSYEAKVLVRLGRWREPRGVPKEAPPGVAQQYHTRHMEAAPTGPELGVPAEAPEEEPKVETDPFAGVNFASDVAYEAARGAELTEAAFRGRRGSGENGAFRKLDVLEIIEDHA